MQTESLIFDQLYLESHKPAYPWESFPLLGKTCESTLRTQGFLTHVVVGDETAKFCCFCSKVVPKEEVNQWTCWWEDVLPPSFVIISYALITPGTVIILSLYFINVNYVIVILRLCVQCLRDEWSALGRYDDDTEDRTCRVIMCIYMVVWGP
jgi:hypothetical protein